MASIDYTPTEGRILSLLADGERHAVKELEKKLSDDLAGPQAVSFHVMRLRRKLVLFGEYIVCEYANRRRFYRHVKLLDIKTRS